MVLKKPKRAGFFLFWSSCTAFKSKYETRHVFYRMLAVCALILRFQSYVITFLGITANGSAAWRGAGLLPTKPQTKYKF